MSEIQAAEKLCASCGADLTHQKCHKDHYGQYLCLTCHRAGRKSPRAESDAEKKVRCIFCSAEVSHRECHKNRYGEHVCPVCHGKGKRWSPRRAFQRSLRHSVKRLLYVLLYVILGVVGLGVAYVILGKILQMATPSGA